jgi:flagellar assembly protein FliH
MTPRYLAAPSFDFATPSSIPADILDRSRDCASAVGYAQGWALGVREARAELAGEIAAARADAQRRQAEAELSLGSALQALADAAAQLRTAAQAAARPAEDTLIAAAVELAEALIGHQLSDLDAATRSALARVLALAPASADVRVRLSVAAHQRLLDSGLTEALAALPGAAAREITIEADPSLQAGDAIATSAATTIDARIGEGIRLMREHLARPTSVSA